MFGRAGAKSGQRILIHAGSGGVGTFAVQYAKHLGLHVTSTTSSKNADFVASLGADRVIAYDRENYLQQDGNYDIVYDTLGGAFTVDAFKVVKRGGVVISLSGPPDRDFARREGAGPLVGIVVWLMGRKVYAASAAAGARYEWSFTESNGDQLRDIAPLVIDNVENEIEQMRPAGLGRVQILQGLKRRQPMLIQNRNLSVEDALLSPQI